MAFICPNLNKTCETVCIYSSHICAYPIYSDTKINNR